MTLQEARRQFVLLGKQHGPYHHELLPITVSLVRLYKQRSNSEPIVLSFIEHAKKILSSNIPHPKAEVAIRYCHIVARLYQEAGKYEIQASALMRHSANIAKSRFGESSVETASCYADCAVYFVGVAQFSTALHFAGRALVIFLSKRGASHRSSAQAQYQVGLIYRLMQTYDRSQDELQHARKMFSNLYGESLEVARVDVSLGFSFHMSKRYLQAERCYERALSVREDKLGPDHALTAEARGLLGEVQLVLQRFSGVPTKQFNIMPESTSPSHTGNSSSKLNRGSQYGHGVRTYDSSELMEALASVGRRTHVPLDISTCLLEASAANKLTAHQISNIVQVLGNNNSFYSFIGNAIANEVSKNTSLYAAVGQRLGNLFGPGSGYGVSPQSSSGSTGTKFDEENKSGGLGGDGHREIMFYGNTIRHAVDQLNGQSRKAGQPAAIGGILVERIRQLISASGTSPMTLNQFVTSISQNGGALDATAINKIKDQMLRNIPYSGSMEELQSQIANTVPASLGLGGAGAGELTVGSREMLLSAIKTVNYLKDKPLISTDMEQTLLAAIATENGGMTLRKLQALTQGNELSDALSNMMRGEISKLHMQSGADGRNNGYGGMNSRSGFGGNYDQGQGLGDGGLGMGDSSGRGGAEGGESSGGNGGSSGGSNGGSGGSGGSGLGGNYDQGQGFSQGTMGRGGRRGDGSSVVGSGWGGPESDRGGGDGGKAGGRKGGVGGGGNDGWGGVRSGDQGGGGWVGGGGSNGGGAGNKEHNDEDDHGRYGPSLEVLESDVAVRRDSTGRRVKVLALDGTELFGLFGIKFATLGMMWAHHKIVRKRRIAHRLLSAGVFQYLLKAKVRQRRALRLCALGLMYTSASERRLRNVGDSLVSMGLFSGLQMAATESREALENRNKKNKKKGGPKKFKTVNLSKDDVIDAGVAKHSLWAKKKSKRGRRDSFMVAATADLEADFAVKTRKKKTTDNKPKKAKVKKANLLPEKEGKKMNMVAFKLTKQYSWEQYADIIEDLDVEAVPLESLESLVNVCPLIKQFQQKVLNWKPDGKVGPTTEEHFKLMNSAELMVFHLAQVEGYKKCLESMLFVKSFDEQIKPLDKSLNRLLKACKEILASDRLPKILQYGKFVHFLISCFLKNNATTCCC